MSKLWRPALSSVDARPVVHPLLEPATAPSAPTRRFLQLGWPFVVKDLVSKNWHRSWCPCENPKSSVRTVGQWPKMAQDGLRLCGIFPLLSRLHEVNLDETENQKCSDGSASMWSFFSCTKTSNCLIKEDLPGCINM